MLRGTRLVITLGALLLAPTATAQEPPETPPLANFSIGLSASPSNEPVTPITETRTTSVNVTVTCEQASIHPGTEPVTIQYGANISLVDATITLSPLTTSFAFTPDGCLQGTSMTDTVDVTVAMTQHAVAGETATVDFTATLDDGTTESVTWDHTVGHYFKSQARLQESIHEGAPGTTLEIPGTLENFGNADITYTFALLPDDARQVDVTLPEPISVSAFDEGTFTVTVDLPPTDTYVNRRDTLQIQATPALAADASVTDKPEQLSAVVQTQGGAGESPGPAMPMLVVLLAALVARRRK